MSNRNVAAATRRLIHEVAVPIPLARTSKSFRRTLMADGYPPGVVMGALKAMRREGLIAKDARPVNDRPHLGHAWSLTSAGRELHGQRLAEQTSWEIAAHEADQPDRR